MKQRRHPEAGYALLFVLAMAASVAILLYMQLPRIAFEAQRDKEQLLIDRGEQYSRAVQLYVRKFNRFPIDMDALEKTQGMRFLRRKYVDPLTGKDDWRLVHVGPGGVFTDSLVHNPKKGDKNAPQTFITEMQQIGGNPSNGGEGANLANRRRPSDQAGGAGDPNNPAAVAGGAVMVLPDGRIVPASTAFGASSPANPQAPAQPGALAGQPVTPFGAGFNGLQTPNGTGAQTMPSGVAFQQPVADGQQAAAPNQQPGTPGAPGQPPAAAADLIRNILTTPRPAPGSTPATIDQNGNAVNAPFTVGMGTGVSVPTGAQSPGAQSSGGQANNATTTGASPTAAGSTGTPAPQGMGGQVIGGGFAGVASKAERDGIKIYNERTAYNEWEFVYDMSKDPARGGGVRSMPANQAGNGAASTSSSSSGSSTNSPNSSGK